MNYLIQNFNFFVNVIFRNLMVAMEEECLEVRVCLETDVAVS